MNDILQFLAGAFLCNCIPHLVCGLQGSPFPTPFAKPRGIGDSPPLINFLWGFFNLLVAIAMLLAAPVVVGFNAGFAVLITGAIVLGVFLSLHFGAVKARRHAT